MKIYIPLIILFTVACLVSSAQTNPDQEKQIEHQKLKAGIDAKQFHFIPTSATNYKGRSVQLTGSYFLFLSVDSLMVSLPFYGRSYSAAAYGGSSEDAGINFHTNEFSYKSDTTTKGGWNITIQPRGQSSASKIYLVVFSNGSCKASVNSSNRSAMTYYGTVSSDIKN